MAVTGTSEPIEYRPIGRVRSPFTKVEDMPIQPIGARGVDGRIELAPELAEGLTDLEGFSHVIVLFHFHRSRPMTLRVRPFLDDREHGVFATRVPSRPNSIGLSVLELVGIEGNVVHVRNVDILDGTPVLDLKPYVPRFDAWDAPRIGWLTDKSDGATHARSDRRFSAAPPASSDDGS